MGFVKGTDGIARTMLNPLEGSIGDVALNNISATNLNTGTVSATGNITGNYILGNGSQLTGIAASTYGNANVAANLAALGSNPVSTTGNVTAGYFIGNGSLLTNLTGANVTGTVANATYATSSGTATSATTAATVTGNAQANITSVGTLTSLSSSGNITGANILTAGVVSATGNITGGNISATNHTGTTLSVSGTVTSASVVGGVMTGTSTSVSGTTTAASVVGGVMTGTSTSVSGNVTGGNVLTSGLISATGNVTAANFFGNGNTLSNVATKFESSWTVPVGNSTQSFTVAASETYYLWVDCNIPNGILAWNATATVTNTNVPVVGAQYAWVYNGGGTPIDFTSIPNQFTGTANAIVRSNVAPSSTTNRFDFGINNTSGGNVTVRYGWVTIS